MGIVLAKLLALVWVGKGFGVRLGHSFSSIKVNCAQDVSSLEINQEESQYAGNARL